MKSLERSQHYESKGRVFESRRAHFLYQTLAANPQRNPEQLFPPITRFGTRFLFLLSSSLDHLQ
jgi:hypothetical protein